MTRVYFARAVDGRDWSHVTREAELFAQKALTYGLTVVDPVLSWGQPTAWTTASDLVNHDLGLLGESDVLLCDMTIACRNYIGCCFELAYAHAWRIPTIVVVGATGYDQRPWLIHHATRIVEDMDRGLEAVAGYNDSRS